MKKLITLFLLLPLLSYAQVKEPWIKKPKEEWPQIALVNDVLYKNGDKYEDPSITYAASGFLLATGSDTLAITAKHILRLARNKASNNVLINDHLKTWKMYPKNYTKDSVIIDRLINEDPSEKLFDGYDNGVLQRDWIVFSTRYISPNIQPLKLRENPVSVGQAVYMIGNPYRFDKTLTAKGYIIKKEGAHLLMKFEDEGLKTAFLGGASGSPIVDTDGYLVGIFSNSRLDIQTGERISLINSTDYLKKILSGAKPLNVNRRPISVYIDSLIQKVGVKKAMASFESILKTEKVYDDYELTYLNYDNLVKIGKDLAEIKKVDDAKLYFDYLLKIYPNNHLFLLALAKVYNQNNEKQKAIKLLTAHKEKVDPEVKEELEKALEGMKD